MKDMIALWVKKTGLFVQGSVVCLCGLGLLALILRIMFTRLPASNFGIFFLLAITSLVLAFVGVYMALSVVSEGLTRVCAARALQPGDLIAARNTQFPAKATLVRAAIAPSTDSQTELLRPVPVGHETPPEQMLRATQTDRQD